MGKKNYTKYSEDSTNDNHIVDPELEQTVLNAGGEVMRVDQNDTPAEDNNNNNTEAENVDTNTEDENNKEDVILPGNAKLIGVVKPAKLNVRKQPTKESEVVEVITRNSEVEIDLLDNEDTMFYKVRTKSGVEGYCMTEFINIK